MLALNVSGHLLAVGGAVATLETVVAAPGVLP